MCVSVDHEVDLKEQNTVGLVSLNHATGIINTVTFLNKGYRGFFCSVFFIFCYVLTWLISFTQFEFSTSQVESTSCVM